MNREIPKLCGRTCCNGRDQDGKGVAAAAAVATTDGKGAHSLPNLQLSHPAWKPIVGLAWRPSGDAAPVLSGPAGQQGSSNNPFTDNCYLRCLQKGYALATAPSE